MKAFVKLPVLFTILLFSFNSLTAQLRLSTSSAMSSDLLKVINDYPNHFINITGDQIIQNPQSTDYRCNFKVTGAEESSITKYPGTKSEIYSWQALMLTTENFAQAKRKFRSLFDEINNLQWNAMRLSGKYEMPTEEKGFSSVLFSLNPADESMRKLKVELVIEAEMMDWKVKILVYDRERDDREKGDVIE